MLTLLLSLALAHALPGYAEPPAPTVQETEDPFDWEVRHEAEEGRIVATLTIPEGHTVYRDQVEIAILDAGSVVLGSADLPRGERRDDPVGRKPREVYASDLVVYLPVRRGEGMVRLGLSHQGCKGGLCFPPVTQERLVLVGAPDEPSR